jgi:hypothetical protein
MNVCWTCGKNIEFRYIKDVRVPIHSSGGCDGRVAKTIAKTQYRPCPKCKRMAYYIEHNGGFFWADELGQPWPKHPCFDIEASRGTTAPSTKAHALNNLNRAVEDAIAKLNLVEIIQLLEPPGQRSLIRFASQIVEKMPLAQLQPGINLVQLLGMLKAPDQLILQNDARKRISSKAGRLRAMELPLLDIVNLLPPQEKDSVLSRAKDLASKTATISNLLRLLPVNQYTAAIDHALGVVRLEQLEPQIKLLAVTRLLTPSQQKAVVDLISKRATKRNNMGLTKVGVTIADMFLSLAASQRAEVLTSAMKYMASNLGSRFI